MSARRLVAFASPAAPLPLRSAAFLEGCGGKATKNMHTQSISGNG
jgi:hypothetical protein